MSPNEETRILVIGGTGRLGRHIVAASARLGHPTAALVRDTAPSDPAKAALLRSFRDAGVTLVKGDLYDHTSLVRPMKAADVVISALGTRQIADQTRLIAAIKDAGGVKLARGRRACKCLRAEVLAVGVLDGRGPHRRRGAGEVHRLRQQGVRPARRGGRGRPAHLRAVRVPRRRRAAQRRAGAVPGAPRRRGRRPRRRRHQGVVRGRGGRRCLHGPGRRRPPRGGPDAVRQAAGQHAVAQRAAVDVGEEDRPDVPAGVRRRGRRPQDDPRGFSRAGHRALDRARGVHPGGDKLQDRAVAGGGRRRALPGRRVHHCQRVPRQVAADRLLWTLSAGAQGRADVAGGALLRTSMYLCVDAI
ncbi:uncharacterized protein [Setaria viridis]|uniref:uncharacterized protein isoform X1 n=1 Tax=Setaria viridis TaxID=4556 RepID=UPI003B3AEC41